MATILIIDDDPSVRRSLRRILETRRHEVREADNGASALDQASAEVDLVITDIYMPEMDGIEFTIRYRGLYPDTPIIAISGGGYASKEFVLEDAGLIGASLTLSKPLTVDGVLGAVDRALG